MAGGQLIEGAVRKTYFMVDPTKLVVIGKDTDDGPEHPQYDERIHLPIDRSMVESIKEFGVYENVAVLVDDDGRIIVSDGRRRTLHNRIANEELIAAGKDPKMIPVTGFRLKKDTAALAGLLAEVLNNHRVQDSVTLRAEKAVRMLARGYTHDQIAMSFAVDVATIKAYERLVEGASEVLRQAIDTNVLSPTAAAKLCELPRESQETELKKLVEKSGGRRVTVRNALAATRGAKNGTDGNAAPSKRELRRVIEGGKDVLSEEFLRGVRFALGDLSPSSIRGLTALMRGETVETADAAE